MKKINLLLCDDAHTFGGAQIAFINLVKLLSKSDIFNIHCIINFHNLELLNQLQLIQNIVIYKGNKAFPFNIFFYHFDFRAYVDIIKRIKIDYAYINLSGIEFGLIYVKSLNKLGIPFSVWMHNPEYYSKLISSKNIFRNTVSLLRDKIADLFFINSYNNYIAVSQYTKNRLIDRGTNSNKIEVIFNPVLGQDEVFMENDIVNKISEFSNGRKIISVIGRIQYTDKGQDQLLNCIDYLKSKNNDLCIVFLGDGPDKANLEKTFHKLDINNVLFLGWINNADAYIKLFNLVLIPSRFETISLVAIETIRQNVKLLVSNIKPFDYIPTELKYKLENSDDLIDKLNNILINDYSTKTIEQLEDIKKVFTNTNCIQNHINHIMNRKKNV